MKTCSDCKCQFDEGESLGLVTEKYMEVRKCAVQ